jgi:hypothetical protein
VQRPARASAPLIALIGLLTACNEANCPGSAISPHVRIDYTALSLPRFVHIRACVEDSCVTNQHDAGNFQKPGLVYVTADLGTRPVRVSLDIWWGRRSWFRAATSLSPSKTEPYGPGCGIVREAAVRADLPNRLMDMVVPRSGV